jgi:hypothetical protein
MRLAMNDDAHKKPPSAANSSIRTTVVLPSALDRNIQALCLANGLSKNELIKTALREFLEKKGLRPDQIPKIAVSY